MYPDPPTYCPDCGRRDGDHLDRCWHWGDRPPRDKRLDGLSLAELRVLAEKEEREASR